MRIANICLNFPELLNSSGKLRQMFAILILIFCQREKQNGLIIVCQSTITLLYCSEVDLLKKQSYRIESRVQC